MKTVRRSFVLAMAIGSLAAYGQRPLIPFDAIEQESQPQIASLISVTSADGISSSSSGARGVGILPGPSVARRVPPVFDRKFLLLNSAHLGAALADVELTQRCIANQHCREGNPLMPSSRGAQLGVSLGMFAVTAGESYWLKKHKSRLWWLAPTVGISAHILGVASGLAH